ncbi:MAG: peptidoglycan-binding protein [Micromonospora sp.]
MSTLYADLSHHDWDRVKGEFDWARIRSATSPVLCLRATYGDPAGYNPTTRHFADMARGAKAAGFDVIGGYHNLIAGDQASINRQVDYLRRELDGVGATWAMLDVERYPELVNNGLYPRFSDAVQFCDRWRVVDSRPLLVYLPRWIWDGHMGRPDLRTLKAPLVASNYGSNPDGSPAGVYTARGGDTGAGWNAYGNVTPLIWQYGSNVDCPGASGATDCNAFRGSLAELRALLTGNQPLEGVAQMFCIYGDRGQNVKYLQYRLHNLGFSVGTVDGVYGGMTAGALTKAMAALGVTDDGKAYGPEEMIRLDVLWGRKFAGAQGPAGPAGPAGPQGPQGEPGPAGEFTIPQVVAEVGATIVNAAKLQG